MKTQSNPTWWKSDYDSTWDRIKEAVKRDGDQTKHDFGGDEPDTDQDVDDTVAQAAGRQPIPPRGEPTIEEIESAYRFGHGARQHYQDRDWDRDLEIELEREWISSYDEGGENDWPRYRRVVHRGWELSGSGETGSRGGGRAQAEVEPLGGRRAGGTGSRGEGGLGVGQRGKGNEGQSRTGDSERR